MRPKPNYTAVWRYAREVGYPHSPAGWAQAYRDLIRATPWWGTTRTPQDELELEMELTK